jgi:hypothetical protein
MSGRPKPHPLRTRLNGSRPPQPAAQEAPAPQPYAAIVDRVAPAVGTVHDHGGSHVQFFERKWADAASISAADLGRQMEEMRWLQFWVQSPQTATPPITERRR